MKVRIMLLFLVFVPAAAYAQRRSDSGVKVVYVHASNHAELRTVDGSYLIQSVAAGTDKVLEVRVPQIVRIEVKDPNPVFFKYTKGETTFVENANYAAALTFAKTIGPAGKFAGLEVGGLIASSTGLQHRLQQLKEYAESMPEIAEQTLLGPDNVTKAKNRVEEWELQAIKAALTNPGATDSTINVSDKQQVSGGELSPGVIANDFDQDNSKEEKKKQKEKDDSVVETKDQKRIKALEAEVADLKARESDRNEEAEELKKIEEAKESLGILERFRNAVRAVGNPISFQPETVNLQQDPTIRLVIDRLPQFPTLEPSQKTGDIAIPLRAYSPVQLGFGPAMVYSFVKAPSFSAEPDGTKFKVAGKPGESRAQNISAMLTITPRSWSDATFGGAFQLGISPVKDQIGLFGGVQIRIANLVSIGGGYGYQQVPRLTGDLKIGDPLDTADALKTENHFKGGAYVAITISLPKGVEKEKEKEK